MMELLFGPEKYDAIYIRITYLISEKSCATYVFSLNYGRIKIDLYDFLPLEETLTLHNAITLIKYVFDRNQNHYYYNIFLEKCLYLLT